MKKTVFISSTFIDLKEERKKIWESLEKFDVIVKGMEEFGARSTDPLTTCLAELVQCDIYIGIIGMRFGSEEPKTKKSYTQLEYEKAKELDKEILIYFIDEENSKVTPGLIQQDKWLELEMFKSTLKAKHTVDIFSNAQDLISKLERKFQEMLTPKEQISNSDEYEKTRQILKSFFLVPKAYTGKEVKLKVKFIDDIKPVSKALCELFNFEYGKTIVSKVTVLHPVFEFKNFRQIFIEYNMFDSFMLLDKSKEYEIFGRALFKEEKVKSVTTNFMDKTERIYNQGDDDSLYDYDLYYDVLREGEGQTALVLKEILIN